LDREFAERKNVELLRARLQLSFPLLKESLLSAVFAGAIGTARALEAAARYEMDLNAPVYLPALCRVGGQDPDGRIPDQDLLAFSVMNILLEVICARFPAHVFHYNGMLAVLILPEEPALKPDAYHLLKQAGETAAYYLKCRLNIGVGAMTEDMDSLPAAVRQAMTALEQSVITPDSAIMSIEDMQYGCITDIDRDENLFRKLSNFIRMGEGAQARGILCEMMAVCRRASPGVKAYQAYLMEILLTFVRIVPEMTLERADFSEAFDGFSRTVFLNCPSFDEAEHLLTALLDNLLEAVSAGRRTARRLLSRQAESYIADHYHNDHLSLDTLCRQLHISPSYFSLVFRKEKRTTFHQYLTALRMDKALELLASTDHRTARVAQMVGIPDPSYFSYCFKKHFGYSPSSVRKQKG
jgi:two-component system response regulator YesN